MFESSSLWTTLDRLCGLRSAHPGYPGTRFPGRGEIQPPSVKPKLLGPSAQTKPLIVDTARQHAPPLARSLSATPQEQIRVHTNSLERLDVHGMGARQGLHVFDVYFTAVGSAIVELASVETSSMRCSDRSFVQSGYICVGFKMPIAVSSLTSTCRPLQTSMVSSTGSETI